MPPFVIHGQLLSDACRLGRLKLCHVLLHKNALVPWFILVPETASAELLEMPALQRNSTMDECALVAGFIKRHFHSTRINCAALGNMVPQLHLHVIGRREDDLCWPGPVWGNLVQERPYTRTETELIRCQLQLELNLQIE